MEPAVLSAATLDAAAPDEKTALYNLTVVPDPAMEYIETSDPLTATFLRSPFAMPSITSLHSLTIGHVLAPILVFSEAFLASFWIVLYIFWVI